MSAAYRINVFVLAFTVSSNICWLINVNDVLVDPFNNPMISIQDIDMEGKIWPKLNI